MPATTDYLSYMLSASPLPLISLLTFFFLALFRIAPIVAIAPFFGSKLPGAVKMGLALSLTLIFLPHVISTASKPLAFDMSFVVYLLKELVIGFILAFLVSIPFYIAQSAGSLIDYLRGSSSLVGFDPTLQTQSSPIGLLYNYILIVIFFQIGGIFYFLDGVTLSFQIVPVDAVINPAFFHSGAPFWKSISKLMTYVIALAIQLSAPALVAILMGEMFLGIANRLAPQVQIAFLGMAIKSLLGIGLLFAGWFFILKQLQKQSFIWLEEIQKLIYSWKM